MAKVYFGPYKAVKYVGQKKKTLHVSLARPKPELMRGDIVIVDKMQAFNLTQKGHGDFLEIDSIEFVKAETEASVRMNQIEAENDVLQAENEALHSANEQLKAELAAADATILSLRDDMSEETATPANESSES